ncbi:MAG: hypothetical protein AAGA48_15135 [Myxococcota bacterium]
MWWLALGAGAQTPPDAWARIDDGDVIVLRPVGAAFDEGFSNADDGTGAPFDRAIERALEDRTTLPDFVAVYISAGQPRLIFGATAFHKTYNRRLEGVGPNERENTRIPIRAGLYLNRPSTFAALPDGFASWIFQHEVGHYWLARVRIDVGQGRDDGLLGRGQSHWNYFLDTGGSPLEGNRWIDNGDGSFTTWPVQGGFSDLDLYLMGLLPPEEVEPFFVIDPTDPNGRTRTSSPDPDWLFRPTTVHGVRIDLSVDDVIAAEGPVRPAYGEAPTNFTVLTVLVVGPEEIIDPEDFVRIDGLHTQYTKDWSVATRTRSQMTFTPPQDRFAVPPIDAPAYIPKAAR